MRRTLAAITAAMLTILLTVSCGEKKAKYVFLFIGDGMSSACVSMTGAYLAQERGVIGIDKINFTSFPVMGEAVSCSANHMITCSSAAGTAMATGFKTNNSMLGVAPDTTELESIAYKIHDAGYAVGITTSVQVNHATPASFYGHSASRSDYYLISEQLARTGFEFFAGGGLIQPTGKQKDQRSSYEIIAENGYTIAYGYDDFQTKKDADKILLVREEESENTLAYALGRKEGELTLEQVVESALTVLERNKKGFFLMAEGGLIDWTAHSHDLAGTIAEILDMDTAVAVALEFYKRHPEETLIVVTADHETGGATLKGRRADFDLTVIDSIKVAATTTDVNEYLNNRTVMDEVNEKAAIGWSTTSHAGGPVPVWAIGAGSLNFAGHIDNTDIARGICAAMGVPFEKAE